MQYLSVKPLKSVLDKLDKYGLYEEENDRLVQCSIDHLSQYLYQGFFLAVFWAALDSGVSEILSFWKNLGYFGLEFSKSP